MFSIICCDFRIVYSLQTLSALVSAIYRKMNTESGSDVINTLIGLKAAESVTHQFLNSCNSFLCGVYLTHIFDSS